MTTSQQVLLGMIRPSSFTFTSPSGGSGSSYSSSPAAVNSGEVVSFVSTTTGATGWNWNFGDGGTSTLQNPTYTYAAGGARTATLTATAALGTVVLGQGRCGINVTAVSSGASLLSPEIVTLANLTPPYGGTPVTATGMTFTSTAGAFISRGVNPDFDYPVPTSIPGHVRGLDDASANMQPWTIFTSGSYRRMQLDIATPMTISTIYAYADVAGLVVLNSTLHNFSSGTGWAWTSSPFVLVDGSLGIPIHHVVFTPSANGLAISNITFVT